MAYEPGGSLHELSRPHNPWQEFTLRNEAKHRAEDVSRLCTSTQATTTEIIEQFLNHDRQRLDEQVPRRRQVLKDFLHEVVPPSLGAARYYFDDIERHSTDVDIALIDDRQKHEDCAKKIRKPCNECRVFSKTLKIPALCQRLKEEVNHPQSLKFDARVICTIITSIATGTQSRKENPVRIETRHRLSNDGD